MTDRDDEIQDRAGSNLIEFFEKGPGLRFSTRSWVIAKDTANDMVYLGGLGGMGDATFAEAPEAPCPEETLEMAARRVREELGD